MPVTIIATVGADDANSFVDLAGAEEYFATRSPEAVNWAAQSDNDKKARALVTAARLMDTLIDWEGEVANEDQALSWPRQDLLDANGEDLDPESIPDEIIWAQCEFAEVLLVTDTTAANASEGIKSIDAGVAIEFSDSAPPTRSVIPDIVYDLVRRWGTRRDKTQGQAQLIRG